ncbi:MAG: hypothetical protein CSA21_04980 [Deltaproteobacteria bacterium]|nr:MAG: hypothetical protein CSA21_04980 [Deltaproteobacteria bacterium]
MIPFLHKKTISCGLNVGTSWLKMVCLRKERQGISLDRLGNMVLPVRAKGDSRAVGKAAKVLHTSLSCNNTIVTSSLRGHEVIVKYMQIPLTKDMLPVVEKEAGEQIPFDLADLYLDFQVIKPGEKKAKKGEVMVVATKKKVVTDLEATLDIAGLSLAVVDVDAFALHNCFAFNYPEQTEPVYLLDIGSGQSILGIHEPGRPFYFREFGFGGQQITQAVAKELAISLEDAEGFKLKGFPDNQHLEASHCMTEVCRHWCQEMKRVEHFFQTSTTISAVPKTMYVSGGGGLLPGLISLFASELDLEITYLEPWRKIDVDTNQFDHDYIKAVGPLFAIPTGLALRGCL